MIVPVPEWGRGVGTTNLYEELNLFSAMNNLASEKTK